MLYATRRIGWAGTGGAWCEIDDDGRVTWRYLPGDPDVSSTASDSASVALAWLVVHCHKDYYDAEDTVTRALKWTSSVLRHLCASRPRARESSCTTGACGQ